MRIKYINFIIISFISLIIFGCSSLQNKNNKTLDSAKSTNISNQINEIQNSKIGGTYKFGGEYEEGPMGLAYIYPKSDSSAIFYLDINRGAPSYNLGQILGIIKLNDNNWYYKSIIEDHFIDCELFFEFTSDKLIIKTGKEHANCGFGHAVYADNSYNNIDKALPEFVTDIQGDTIKFKELSIKELEYYQE